jgi:hypothetical protein
MGKGHWSLAVALPRSMLPVRRDARGPSTAALALPHGGWPSHLSPTALCRPPQSLGDLPAGAWPPADVQWMGAWRQPAPVLRAARVFVAALRAGGLDGWNPQVGGPLPARGHSGTSSPLLTTRFARRRVSHPCLHATPQEL